MDPITIASAVTVATKAFSALKAGFQAGRDIEQMSGDISRWMSSVSDIDNANKQAQNPSLYRQLLYGNSVEKVAFDAFTAKKKLAKQREELKLFLMYQYGPNAWKELIAMEGKIRKQRQEMIYKKEQLKEQIINWIAIVILTMSIIGFIFILIY